jgi:hypothetical protein
MEQDSNLGNLHIHEGLLHEILGDLETAHHILMIRESLDINRETEKSFMLKFEERVSQALTAQEVRLKSEKPQLEPENEKHPKISQDKRFKKTGKAREREVQEASLTTAIIRMKLDENPENANAHKRILHRLLDYLKSLHQDLIRREARSIHVEPEKTYMLEFKGKVSRAQGRSGRLCMMEKLMARKRKGLRRIRGGKTQPVEEDNSRKNLQTDGPRRNKNNKRFLELI